MCTRMYAMFYMHIMRSNEKQHDERNKKKHVK